MQSSVLMEKNIEKFIKDQLSVWPEAATNYRALKGAFTRNLHINGLDVILQFNPGRIVSTAAKVDRKSIAGRKCFLCRDNRPQEQLSVKFEGRKGRKYDILLNPYPIFQNHLVIARDIHSPQSIWRKFVDMTDLARHYPDFTILYNGPECGASAPDHMHFQAVPRRLMPLENDVDALLDNINNGQEEPHMSYVTSVQDARLFHYDKFTKGVFVLSARTSKSLAKLFYRLLDCLPENEEEPMFNLLVWYKVKPDEKLAGISHGRFGEYRAVLMARDKHRSHHYYSDDKEEHLTVSPGCADMAGFFVVPCEEDYKKLDENLIQDILREVSVSGKEEEEIIWKLTRRQPEIQVGIMSGKEISFEIISDGAGRQKVIYENGRISYNGALYDELVFDACTMASMFAGPTFVLYDVTIGKQFHWERRCTQKFAGSLKFIVEESKITAVNIIGMEDYLLSVISSEMSPGASPELLKAHAVISRSWLHSCLVRRNLTDSRRAVSGQADDNRNDVYVKWFGREEHKSFDVCADDHCQRYQGLTENIGNKVRKVIDQTWGQVLTYDGEICDTRFSKCCGGVTELFSSCWEDRNFPYLKAVPDIPSSAQSEIPDLGIEDNAERWIMNAGDVASGAFCNTHDNKVLSQVLNDYDLETKDFFRWKESYTRSYLSELFARRSGFDIGMIESLEPVKRGASGRIILLSVKGTLSSVVIGKELLIRKFLSETHLKSSAFVVKVERSDDKPENDRIVFYGAGWGHGVGLCQIGAAMMSVRGYKYKEILSHYYPGSEVICKYTVGNE